VKRSCASWKASCASLEFCWVAAYAARETAQLGPRARDLELRPSSRAAGAQLQLGDAILRLRELHVGADARKPSKIGKERG
jgi:hypothetical protein